MARQLVLATRNNGKIEEMKHMLQGFDIEVLGLDQFPECPEVVEDGQTFIENAKKKAETISEYLQLPALADDSGLKVEALNGQPGVYSARYASLHASDEENNQKLINALHDVPDGERFASFHCVLALAIPGEETWTCEGTCGGQILRSPTGSNGFGYDPLFFLPELRKTMAQLTKEEKNQISHRGQAMRQFLTRIEKGL
ncbi:XTP/dITP diphosphatase [Ammoniphilus resinae]|uniref:dITP/XTP pyrophosphatase n=1 Tax=Ammoniphilus resinae TaxID=861532 RepID=A0ABS4GJE8_9BACL|nr:XTP/dITP diphosphatase [Ammoniphilus resinae]MBP1930375.1 XTP/dITP diphosphohydrolase [Ammoniphilus resinae]